MATPVATPWELPVPVLAATSTSTGAGDGETPFAARGGVYKYPLVKKDEFSLWSVRACMIHTKSSVEGSQIKATGSF